MRFPFLLLVMLVIAQTIAHAQQTKLKPEAQTHLDAALKAYSAKDYDVAFREFDAAYAADPNPALLYATAQALRHADKCPQALTMYKRFLDTHPSDPQVAAASSGIALCQQALKASAVEPPPKPEPTPPPQPEPKPEPGPVAQPAPEPGPDLTGPAVPPPTDLAWYKDKLADGLVVSGVIGIGVGVVFLAKGSSSEQAAHDAQFREDFIRHLDDATSQRRIGAVALSVGTALAAGGVVVYVLHRKTARTIVGGTDGRSLYVAGAF
jgi:tetratricopeptide (TPR) repeat protein